MASKRLPDDANLKSPLRANLPRERRGSAGSIASRRLPNSETLASTLDHIHTSASRSETLTTFSEYAPPPRSSVGSEGRGLAGELVQGGFTGLYNRLKASVGTARESGAASPTATSRSVESDEASVKSLKLKPSHKAANSVGAVESPAAVVSTPSPLLKSPASSKFPESITSAAKLPVSSSASLASRPSALDHASVPSSQSQSRPASSSVEPHGEPMPARHVGNLQRGPDPVPSYESSRKSSLAQESLTQVISTEPFPDATDDPPSDADEEFGPQVPSEAGIERGHASNEPPLSRISSQVTNVLDSAAPRGSNLVRVELNSAMGSLERDVDVMPARAETPQRPPLLHISPSHLPGFRASRATSSDGDLSSVATVAASRHSNPVSAAETARLRAELQKSADASGPYMGNRLLAREFWMRDENAKDCFYCGETFSTFRRKHHCRTCGQIFDAKCTSIVSGKMFGIGGTVRVCKPCEHIINGTGDDSSVFSGTSDEEFSRHDHELLSPQEEAERSVGTPTIGIPVSRKSTGQNNRRSAVLEFDGHPTLARPSSSRSLRSLSGRPHTPHKRHHSRHQLMRTFKNPNADRAPFRGQDSEGSGKDLQLPAFHHDNIIDPDLAPFLSDEGSSEEETVSLFATLEGDKPSTSAKLGPDGPGFNALFSSVRKGKSRGDRSIRDGDAASISSKHMQRHSRKRNVSVNSMTQARPSPRRTKSNSLLKGFPLPFGSSLATSFEPDSPVVRPVSSHSRMTRSASMRGEAAPPVELNQASLQHVRKMLKQLLQDAEIPSARSWERALVPILLKCTNDVNPDIRRHDFIDIRHYVKIKKITGAKPGDTSYVSGVVFTKNVALKTMSRSISQPRIIIVTFAIEYARHNQHFMSLDPVISQEKEYLRNLVRRIVAFDPHVLLVQKNVSGLALKLLADAGISVICNVKASVLNAVSRCTQAKLISSVDKLVFDPNQVGQCGSFDVKTYVKNNIKKTYVWLSGCRADLGCTIVLRGSDSETLRRLKRITEFMCYVVYNLRLETNLMRDEYVFIPPNSSDGTIAEKTKPLPVNPSNSPPALPADGANTADTQEANDDPQKPASSAAVSSHVEDAKRASIQVNSASTDAINQAASDARQLTDSGSLPSFYDDVVEKHKTKILSTSPFVKFMPPYLLMQAREQEGRLAHLKHLRDQYKPEEGSEKPSATVAKFQLVQPEMVQGVAQKPTKQVKEFLYAVHDAEYDKAMFGYMTQKRQWESYISETINLFDPFSHQRIAFLYSMVNSQSTTPCIGPEVIALEFYNEQEIDDGFATDITLGQYIVDLIHGASTICGINGCERTLFNHHRQYVHGPGQMSVYVQKHPPKLSGLQGTILMWSQCRICQAETPPIPMSDSTWRYSFGKYLELTFWSSELHPRAKVCPHDIHRDHLRYFGLHNAAVRIQFDPIQLHEVIIPRSVVTWKVDNDLRLKNDQYQKIKDRLDKFMQSVKGRIKGIHVEGVLPEKMEACRTELDRLSRTAEEDHLVLLKKLQEKYMKSRYYEIIPFNRAVRFMHERAIWWDYTFADFERNFFPSEKDIRRLAQQQLKKLFIEKDESTSSTTSNDEELLEHPLDEKDLKQLPQLTPAPSDLSAEDAQSLLKSGLEKVNSDEEKSEAKSIDNAPPAVSNDDSQPSSPAQLAHSEEVKHLDLAIPNGQSVSSSTPGQSESSAKSSGGSESPTPVPTPVEPAPLETHVSAPPRDASLESKIPRPVDQVRHSAAAMPAPPPLSRAQSQPAELFRRHYSAATTPPFAKQETQKANLREVAKGLEKRLTERLGGTIRVSRNVSQSLIPRSVPSNRRDMSRVSTLAKHFEQLTRELEKERLRERRLRMARTRQARGYPLASSKPTMEVFSDVHQAVHGHDSPEDSRSESPTLATSAGSTTLNESTQTPASSEDSVTLNSSGQQEEHGDRFEAGEGAAAHPSENTPTASDAEGEETDAEGLDEPPLLSPTGSHLDLNLELPKSEKVSLMKMLRSFWSERSASGWTPLEYPLMPTEHVWDNSDVIVREDEPSSIIALALSDRDYLAKLRSFRDQPPTPTGEKGSAKKDTVEMLETMTAEDEASAERNLLRVERTHISYSFVHRGVRARCKIFYAESFDAIRRKCGIADRFVESLSRCLKWDSKGGKTKSLFLKTRDDRFVLKSLSQPEITAFFKFAPNYFSFMHQILFKSLPSVIAKLFGLFQVTIKNPATGVEFDWFMLVMENLFYHREPDRRFDLKGSMRNRKIQSTGERDEVLQDENLVEIIFEKPLFVREHTMTLLQACVWNDTLFLSQQNVMDYSLMAGFVDDRLEIIVGIIDCIRTYGWDKKLETWIKDRGKNKPTITSPKDYKNRFRIAMSKYILLAPNCWHHFQSQIQKRPLRLDVRNEGQEAEEGEVQIPVAVSGLSDPR